MRIESREPSQSERSVLGADALVIGDITGEGSLDVAGRVQGNIKISGDVNVLTGASVLGHIQANSLKVSGKVRGNLSARVSIEVGGAGEIEGKLEAPRIGIETGAYVVGSILTGPPGKAASLDQPGLPRAPSALEAKAVPERFPLPPKARVERVLTPSLPAVERIDDEELSQESEEDDLQEGFDSSEPDSPTEERTDAGGPRRKRRRRRNRRPEHDGRSSPNAAPFLPKSSMSERPTQTLGSSPSESLALPRIPTFQKGTHGRRRD